MQKLKDWLSCPEMVELRKKPIHEIIEEGFHRERITPIWLNYDMLFSPANGILLYVKHIKSKDEIVSVHGAQFTLKELVRQDLPDDEFIVIGIFMSFYDIHTNYFPSAGFIRHTKLPMLKIDNLSMTKVELEYLNGIDRPDTGNMDYLFYNERVINTIFDSNLSQEYHIIQIADAECGAIIPFKKQNTFGYQGEPFSAIRFGSQVDLVIPIKKNKKYEILVDDKIGWHVDAVSDPLVRITDYESTVVQNYNHCHGPNGRFCSTGGGGSGGGSVGGGGSLSNWKRWRWDKPEGINDEVETKGKSGKRND